MLPIPSLVASLLLLLGSGGVQARNATSFAYCQRPKAQGSQLLGCPNGTIYVSQDDPQAAFGSISQAISSLPDDLSPQVVLIGAGQWHDVVNVTRRGPVTLLGLTDDPTSLSANLVHIWNASFINQTTQLSSQDNADASVFTVSPNRAASLVGAGPLGAPLQSAFGCVDFRAYNLNVSNKATVNGREIQGQTGPAAALVVAYANASFYQSTFNSYQDTIYIGRNASVYMSQGMIRGSVDFLYGFGTLWLESTTLASRGLGGALTAWKGSTQWYGPNTFGCYISNSKILRADDALPSVNLTNAVSLGRPWNNQSRVVYLNTYMSDIVLPAGFTVWSASDPRVFPNVTEFVESGSTGPGARAHSRNRTIETLANSTDYTIESVFGSQNISWIDAEWL